MVIEPRIEIYEQLVGIPVLVIHLEICIKKNLFLETLHLCRS